jgi:hypothetical protein
MAFVLSCSLSALGIAADSNAVPRELGPSDWASIQKAYEAARLELHSSASGATGHNPGQRWRSHFDGRGVLVEPNHGAWTWGLELSGYGRGSDWVNVTTPTRTITNGATSTYVWDDRLEEWYVNERRGLEHGFTLRSRPSGDASDDLRIDLEVRGDSVPRADADARGVTFCDGERRRAHPLLGSPRVRRRRANASRSPRGQRGNGAVRRRGPSRDLPDHDRPDRAASVLEGFELRSR